MKRVLIYKLTQQAAADILFVSKMYLCGCSVSESEYWCD